MCIILVQRITLFLKSIQYLFKCCVYSLLVLFKATEANLGHIKQILGIRYKELKNLLQRI